MLKSYAAGAFDGFGANGNSKDWRDWSGVCHGYERTAGGQLPRAPVRGRRLRSR
ncbi:MAG: hypothetical protein U1E76_22680 [Planctomycetota bacterium]